MRLRSVFSSMAAVAVVATVVLNLGRIHADLAIVPVRAQNDPIVWEERMFGVRGALLRAAHRGDVGYILPKTLEGGPWTEPDSVRWCHARYALIPWNVTQNTLDAPFVLADFHGSAIPAEFPPGFTPVYRSDDGLILLKRTHP